MELFISISVHDQLDSTEKLSLQLQQRAQGITVVLRLSFYLFAKTPPPDELSLKHGVWGRDGPSHVHSSTCTGVIDDNTISHYCPL